MPIAKPSGGCGRGGPRRRAPRRAGPTLQARLDVTVASLERARRRRTRNPAPATAPPRPPRRGALVEAGQQQPRHRRHAHQRPRPRSEGRGHRARSPSRNTGIAPRPVASAVADAARRRVSMGGSRLDDRRDDPEIDGDRKQVLNHRGQRPGAEGRVDTEALEAGAVPSPPPSRSSSWRTSPAPPHRDVASPQPTRANARKAPRSRCP